MVLVLGAVAVGSVPLSAEAQTSAPFELHLARQPLRSAIQQLALLTRTTILLDDDAAAGLQVERLDGRFTVEQALSRLLREKDLTLERVAGGFVIRLAAPSGAAADPDVVVTGSRIRGAGPTGSNLITVDRKAIEQSGYATTQQLLQSLPQNYGGGPNEGTVGFSVRNGSNANFGYGSSINLRGLGTTSTLTLIDGNRVGLGSGGAGFVDLTLIPATAIDRIEVLADGASALYGSDAVAGVVNVRLRNDYKGAESRLRFGGANGFDEVQASQLIGVGWHGGHLTLGYEFYRRGNLPAADRRYGTEDLRRFGGPDYRSTFANPGTIIADDGRLFSIPASQNGTGLTAADLLPGRSNLGDGRANADLLPQVRRQAAVAALTQEIGPTLQLTAQLFVADRKTYARTFPDNYGNIVVPTTNPFYVDPIGTGQPITVNYSFEKDFGPEANTAHVHATAAVVGVEDMLGAWTASLNGSYGVQREVGRAINLPNYYNLALALADTNPLTAYNLIGDGSYTNLATIDRVRGFYHQVGRSQVWTGSARLEGPLFTLPGGTVRLAFGSEFRRERYSFSSTDYEFTPEPIDGGSGGFPISRSISAVFAELLLPVIGAEQGIPGVRALTLSLAGRAERYSDVGSTRNPKVGLLWQPTTGVGVRGSFGTSFRAPSFFDVRTGRDTAYYMPFVLPDPRSPSGTTTALVLFGANPSIGPEKARSWTVGVDLSPAMLPGVRATVSYFNIRYRDRIVALGVDYLSFLGDRATYGDLIIDQPSAASLAPFYNDINFHNPLGIAASDIQVVLDGRTRNLSLVTLEGVDFDIGYQRSLGRGSIELGVSGSYLFRYRQRITASAPISDVVSTIGFPIDLRARGRLIGSAGPASVAVFVNYTDGYRNTAVVPEERVKSWTTTDVQFGYDLTGVARAFKRTRVNLDFANVFDRAPPYVNNRTPSSAAGFDPDNASPIGRQISLELVKAW